MPLLNRLPPALQRRDYGLLWIAILVTGVGGQMVAVAVGWQVYSIRRSAFDLGLIGLMEFLPLPLLALPAGHIADRVPRRRVLALSLALEIVVAGLLVGVSLAGASKLWPFLVLAALAGVAGAIGMPAGRALPATLVPMELIPSAMALRTIAFQAAVVAGPALGGIVFTISPEAVYGTATVLLVVGLACTLFLREPPVERDDTPEPPGLKSLAAGVGFVRNTPVLLGAISLDLFAVFFGGAVALLPLFARSILHTGPVGLGLLRAAPAVGAVLAGVWLTHRPLRHNAGRTLLVVVAIFGASMIVFGLSTSLPLSLLALGVSGYADMISMNIRGTTVAVATPDPLRGRVLAVEMVFISGSNELGAFESGLAASIFGAVTAVVAGGVITIGLAVAWLWLFPALANVDRMEDLAPERV
jgi:MFS family permease